jgi:SNF2 family DNA or RNA helicase
VVFSYFRDVLDRVHQALGGRSAGQLTGSVAPDARQRLVDGFSALPEPAVLVAQIEAGGVGLNLQAASVVILTEPQWKPSTEAQAIARCQRMGQVRTVEVHRLLTEDSVDEHMVAVLAGKSDLFARYAHRSSLKESTPAAVDVTDADAVDQVIDQVSAERRILVAERHRLGVDTVEP